MAILGFLYAAILYVLVLSAIAEDAKAVCPWTTVRLPQSIIPTEYVLALHTDLPGRKLNGTVTINLQVVHESSLIVLHADKLTMDSYEITVNQQIANATFVNCDATSFWTFALTNPLKNSDTVAIKINYNGAIYTDGDLGLFIVEHKSENGKHTWESAITQFEPTGARKMLPCFDEPRFKAHFTLAVTHDKKYTVLSNMKSIETTVTPQAEETDHFGKTPRMSTYLLALALLDNYSSKMATTKKTAKHIDVTIFAPTDALKDTANFGLDTAVRALEFFEKYFKIGYPLLKADLIALDGFAHGAMENWGMMTFRDTLLLSNKATSSQPHRENIALAICHEWFGNLVTMEWWGELWLNEGFAHYLQSVCVNDLFPEWKFKHFFYSENVAESMELDGLASTGPVSDPVAASTTTNFEFLFNTIAYQKGASIINMIATQMGTDKFRAALHEYLSTHTYGFARAEELLKIIANHSTSDKAVSVPELIRAFTLQPGFPVINADFNSSRKSIVVSDMRRFFFDTNHTEDVASSWPLPVTYRTSMEMNLQDSIPGRNQSASFPIAKPATFAILNSGGAGYYKVLYNLDNYEAIISQLSKDHTKISSVDRAVLISDAFDFVKAGMLDISIYLRLVMYSSQEADRMVWFRLFRQLQYIESLVVSELYLHPVESFQHALIKAQYERLGWNAKGNEAESEDGMRAIVLSMACRQDIETCLVEARKHYLQWDAHRKTGKGSALSPAVLGAALEFGLELADEKAWEEALSTLKQINGLEQSYLLAGVARTADPSRIRRLLDLTISKDIDAGLIYQLFGHLSTRLEGRKTVWTYVKKNYDRLFQMCAMPKVTVINELPNATVVGLRLFKATVFSMGLSRMLTFSIKSIGDYVSTRDLADDMKHFLEEKEISQHFTDMFEQIDLNIQWRLLNEVALNQWLLRWKDEQETGKKGTTKKFIATPPPTRAPKSRP